ncbi:MAG: hypothetical protein QM503_06060 [Bacteroidota bacterium]
MRLNYLIAIILTTLFLLTTFSCNKGSVNPDIPRVVINVTINPNSTIFQQLNTVGGWLYLEEQPGIYIPSGSRGVIVYRMTLTEFKAYERQPPNFPFECCDANGFNCSKLIVGGNYPFVKDTCNDNLYQLLDGSLFQGVGQYPLIEYNAMYDGALLHVFN